MSRLRFASSARPVRGRHAAPWGFDSPDVVSYKNRSPAHVRAKTYPEGFAQQVAFTRATHSHPSSAAPVLGLTQAVVTLSGGGLAQSISNPFMLGYGNRVKDLSSDRSRLSFSATSGAFTGRVLNPATGRPVTFQGVVLQDQQMGAGCLLGPGQSGWVWLAAR